MTSVSTRAKSLAGSTEIASAGARCAPPPAAAALGRIVFCAAVCGPARECTARLLSARA